MVEMSVLLEKMLIFLVLMVIGWVLAKKGMLDKNSTRAISSLTINVFMCASIIGSALGMDRDLGLSELGRLLLIVFAMQLIGYIVAALVARLFPGDRERTPVFELLMSMGNTMFIALPIVQMIYGAAASFYVALSCLPFNVLLYTYGVYRLSKSHDGGTANNQPRYHPRSPFYGALYKRADTRRRCNGALPPTRLLALSAFASGAPG